MKPLASLNNNIKFGVSSRGAFNLTLIPFPRIQLQSCRNSIMFICGAHAFPLPEKHSFFNWKILNILGVIDTLLFF